MKAEVEEEVETAAQLNTYDSYGEMDEYGQFGPEAEQEDYFKLPEPEYWERMLYVEDCRALIGSAAAQGDWQEAFNLLEEMRQHGHSPDLLCHEYVLHACRIGFGGARKARDLIEEMWKKDCYPTERSYANAITACELQDEPELAQELRTELAEWGTDWEPERFQLVPRLAWERPLRKLGVGAHNSLNWNCQRPFPKPPEGTSMWLIPSQDEAALFIAQEARELRELGWKVIDVDPDIVDTLRNKAKLRRLAEKIGHINLLPVHYDDPATAVYPCILKPALGTFGKDTHVVHSAEVVGRLAPGGLGDRFLLQECISGSYEFSTSLLVKDGKLYDAVSMRYLYSLEEYVWPHVRLVSQEFLGVPAAHLAVFEDFLVGFSGICNFNYKLRPDGKLCIFEVNPRVGGDLSFDIPRPRGKEFFEKLDRVFS